MRKNGVELGAIAKPRQTIRMRKMLQFGLVVYGPEMLIAQFLQQGAEHQRGCDEDGHCDERKKTGLSGILCGGP